MEKSRIEFIKDLHNDVREELQAKIENEFTEIDFKPELEVGVWYIKKSQMPGNYLFCFKEIDKNKNVFDVIGYGFTGGVWGNVMSFSNQNGFTKATDKEVEQALIKEAKKRGFKDGVMVKMIVSENIITLKGDFELLHKKNVLWFGVGYNGYDIFKDGKWATIIDQPTKMTVEEVEKKLGYKVEIIS